VSDLSQAESRKLAGLHAAAARAILLQHKSLDGLATDIRWEGDNYNDLPFLATRSMASMRCIFAVTVQNTVTEAAGPRTPLPEAEGQPPNVPPEYGDITDVEIHAHPVPITTPLP
jgi:hypothetical protein